VLNFYVFRPIGTQHVRPSYAANAQTPFVPFDFPDATSTSANKFADVDYAKLDSLVKGVCWGEYV
jgi:hypothetical protein